MMSMHETFVEPETMPANDPVQRRDLTAEGFARRYRISSLLGKGGMGEVRLAEDARIGREVAVKMLDRPHEDSGDARARFIREAFLQGQLEHPSIVPVYDVGLAEDGQPYFTMKRVRGVTLSEVFHRLRNGDREARAKYSRRKLLTAFSAVCLTIDFAHRRGVLHRDLKPANIMLGDFGEVYVLDWGVSKMTGAPEPSKLALVGTPGYMAPEQIGGVAEALTERADIYALGAILFEILALEPLHARADREQAIRSTLQGVEARVSIRAPHLEIPPEVEAICVRATDFVPTRRHASARELHEAIERYLDGDRDLEMRTTRAKEHAERAELLIEQASSAEPEREEASRSQAMNEVGRALALDPRSRSAMKSLVRLLLEPPRTPPKAAQVALEAYETNTFRAGAMNGVMAYIVTFTMAPMMIALGVRDWTNLGAGWGLSSVNMVLLFLAARGAHPDSRVLCFVRYTIGAVAISFLTRCFSPFMIVPALSVLYAMSYAFHPDRTRRGFVLWVGGGIVAVPALLEMAGLIEPTYLIQNGMISIIPNTLEFPTHLTPIYLLFANAGVVMLAVRYIGRVRNALSTAEARLHLYSWHLRQLVPRDDGLSGKRAAAPTALR